MSLRENHPWIAQERGLRKEKTFYPVTIPDCKNKLWEVSTYFCTENDVMLANMRAVRDRMPELCATPGTYRKLVHKQHGLVMTNTQMEYRTNCGFVERAAGNVLVTGLGLGMILNPLAKNNKVTSITVLEISRELIHLVGKYYIQDWKHTRVQLEIVEADAYTWKPRRGQKWDCAWHDIWNTLGAHNLPLYSKIKAHYRHRVGWQACWAENLCQRMKVLQC